MTYPLPLGFQHAQYRGECVAGSFSGVWCAVLLFCMLKVAPECTWSFGDWCARYWSQVSMVVPDRGVAGFFSAGI